MTLPQLTADHLYLTDGGLETTLVFHEGLDLPLFAAFPLLDSEEGRSTLVRYYDPYLELAERLGTGFVLDTPTWRANADWGDQLGYDEAQLDEVNQRAVAFVAELAAQRPALATVLNGVIGPRGDGYVVETALSPEASEEYHGLQARAFAAAGADMITAVTMTSADEATGIVRAASQVALPVVVSFTVETDGRLPSGQPLDEAVSDVDAGTGAAASYFMINCAHPTHFLTSIDEGAGWASRIRAVRSNASPLSHAELDEATELDRGDIAELAGLHQELSGLLDLRVVGGCCGTDAEHVTALATALIEQPRA